MFKTNIIKVSNKNSLHVSYYYYYYCPIIIFRQKEFVGTHALVHNNFKLLELVLTTTATAN